MGTVPSKDFLLIVAVVSVGTCIYSFALACINRHSSTSDARHGHATATRAAVVAAPPSDGIASAVVLVDDGGALPVASPYAPPTSGPSRG